MDLELNSDPMVNLRLHGYFLARCRKDEKLVSWSWW